MFAVRKNRWEILAIFSSFRGAPSLFLCVKFKVSSLFVRHKNIVASGNKVERGLELDTMNAGAPYEAPVGVVMPVGK